MLPSTTNSHQQNQIINPDLVVPESTPQTNPPSNTAEINQPLASNSASDQQTQNLNKNSAQNFNNNTLPQDNTPSSNTANTTDKSTPKNKKHKKELFWSIFVILILIIGIFISLTPKTRNSQDIREQAFENQGTDSNQEKSDQNITPTTQPVSDNSQQTAHEQELESSLDDYTQEDSQSGLRNFVQAAIDKSKILNEGILSFEWLDKEVSDDLTISSSGSVADGALSENVSLLGSYIDKSELINSGTLSFTWTDAEVSNTLTIGADSTIDSGALPSNLTQLGQTISKDELENSGTLSFDWANSEVADDLTISSSGSVADGALSSSVANLDVAETIAADWVNTAYPWLDTEVADNLTISAYGSVADGALSSNVSLLGQTISSSEIEDDSVQEIDLAVSNTPVSGYILSYSSGGELEWIVDSSATAYTAGDDLDLASYVFSLESILDTVTTINMAGIGSLNDLDSINNTTETTIETAIDTLANLTSAASLATVGTITTGTWNADPIDIVTYSNLAAGDYLSFTGSTLNVSDSWYDSVADMPTATPSDGDTTHVSTADQIYDYIDAYAFDDTSVPKNHLVNSGTLSFEWSDAEVSDTLTASDLQAGSSVVADSEVDDDLTISSSGTVAWTALSSYPTGCSAGQAVQVIGDTLTCIDVDAAGTLTGSGTSGRVARFSGTTSLESSGISDSSDALALAISADEDITVYEDIIPDTTGTGNVGGPSNYFNAVYTNELYTSGSSIYMDGVKILQSSAPTLIFSADTDQNLQTKTTGTGALQLQASGTGALQLDSDTGGIALTTTSTGDISLTSNDKVQIASGGTTDLESAETMAVQTTGASANINLTTTGTGSNIVLNASDNSSQIQLLAGNGITTNTDLDVTGDITGTSLSDTIIQLLGTTNPTPTDEGDIRWDSDDDVIVVGDGAGGTIRFENSASLDGLTDTDLNSPASGHILVYDGSDSWDNKAMSGDATLAATGALSLGSSVVQDAEMDYTQVTLADFTNDANLGDLTANETITGNWVNTANPWADNEVAALASASQGDILYYNGASWSQLAAGNSGQYLQTKGAAANPEWASVSGAISDGTVNNSTLRWDGNDWVESTALSNDDTDITVGNDLTVTNNVGISNALDVTNDITAGGDLTVTGDDIFMTTNTLGHILVADGNSYNPVDMSGDIDINASGATTIQPDSVALTTDTTGNYVATLTNGSGITGADGGSEGATLTLALGDLTSDWSQQGAFDIILNDADSQLQIKGSGIGENYYGTFDVNDLADNRTYNFPDASGEVTLLGQSIGTTEVESGITLDVEWDTEGEVETIWSKNIIIEAEIDSSSEIAAIVSDETGSGALVFANAPTFSGTVTFSGIDSDITTGTDEHLALMPNGSGNVGIGTTTPDQLLHAEIADSATDSVVYGQRISHITSGTAATGLGTGIEFEIEGADGSNNVLSTIQAIQTSAGTGAEEGELAFLTADLGDDDLAERMRINKDGNVGIGTTTPSYKLEITGDGYISTSFETGTTMTVGSTLNIGSIGSTNDNNRVLTSSAAGSGDVEYIDTTDWDKLESDDVTGSGTASYIPKWDTGGESLTDSIMYDDGTNIGIGTTSPTDIFTLSGESKDLHHYSYSNSEGSIADYDLYWARGTESSPVIVQDDDRLGSIKFYGWDGTDEFKTAAQIRARIDGTPADNDVPGSLEFLTAQDGSGSPTVAMLIDDEGNVGINDTAPAYKLEVGGDVSIVSGADLYLTGVGLSSTGGAAKVGVNDSGMTFISATDVQNALGDLDSAISSGAYSYWTARDHDGTSVNLSNGQVLQYLEGTGIDIDFTATGASPYQVTITNTGDTDGSDDYWTLADDDVVAPTTAQIDPSQSLSITSSDSNIVRVVSSGTNTDHKLDLSVRSLGDIVVGDGLSGAGSDNVLVGADADVEIALDTPGTLSVSSSNAAAGNHTHEITSSSSPASTASLLASAADGGLQLVRLGLGADPDSDNRLTVVDGGQIGQTAGALIAFDDTNDYLEVTGANVGIGTTEPGYKLEITGDGYISTSFETGTTMTVGTVLNVGSIGSTDDNNRVLTSSAAGSGDVEYIDSTDWDKDATDDVIGSGTLNYIPKWDTGGQALTDSIMYEDGTNIGIGTTSPSDLLTLFGENQDVDHYSYSDTEGYQADYNMYWSRGNVGTPAIVQDGDRVGSLRFYGWDGNDEFRAAAQIRAKIDGTPADNDVPGKLEFLTSRDSTGTLSIRMTINEEGNVGIGTTSPDQLLHTEISDSATDSVVYGQRLSHITSGLAAAGLGTGIEFEIEGADGTNNVLSTIQAIQTGASTGAEDGALAFLTADFGVDPGDDGLVERMRINKDGNVGIGDTDPGSMFVVQSENDFYVNSTGNVYGKDFYDVENTNYYINPSSGGDSLIISGAGHIGATHAPIAMLEITNDDDAQPILRLEPLSSATTDYFQIGSTAGGSVGDVFVVDSSGNVGIADTDPGAMFVVQSESDFKVNNAGNVYAKTFYDIENENYFLNPSAGGDSSLIISGSGHIGDSAAPIAMLEVSNVNDDNPILRLEPNSSPNTDYFQIGSTSDGSTGDIMVVDENGNVGIGNTDPDVAIDIKKDYAYMIDFDRTDNIMVDNVFNMGVHYSAFEDDFLFLGLDGQTDDFVITDDGCVGIGETEPNATLQIIGSISRANTYLRGTATETHVNLGEISTTGKDGDDGSYITIGGGWGNQATETWATIAGGASGTASALGATIGGGISNTASGSFSTVSGGMYNTAGGDYSWAGGAFMQLTSDADHTFVWGYDTSSYSISTSDVFLIDPNNSGYNVGIGVSDPDQKLEINGHLKFSNTAIITTDASHDLTITPGRDLFLGTTNTDSITIGRTDTGSTTIQSGGANALVVSSGDVEIGGNVGIGVSPAYPLDMYYNEIGRAMMWEGAFSGGNIIGQTENKLIRADEKYTVSWSGTSPNSGGAAQLFDGDDTIAQWTSWTDGVTTSAVTIDFGGIRHYWQALKLHFQYSRGTSGVKIEKYADPNGGDGWSCDDAAWATVYETSSHSGHSLDVSSNLGNGICKFRVTLSGTAAVTNDIRFAQISGYQYYYGLEGPYARVTGDTIYGDTTIGTSSNNRTLSVLGNVGIGTTTPRSGYALDVAGSVDMSNYNIDYANQLHFNDGLYLFGQNDDSFLVYQYADSGAGGIVVYDGDSQRQGYLYASGSQQFGLLDGDGNWAVQLVKDNYTDFYINNVLTARLDNDGGPFEIYGRSAESWGHNFYFHSYNYWNTDNSELWDLVFSGPNSADEVENRGIFRTVFEDIDDGTEDLRWEWWAQQNGTFNLGMKLISSGDLYTDAGMHANNWDLAESIPIKDKTIEQGDIVSADSNYATTAKKATQSYNPNLIGVITTNPGMVLGTGGFNTDINQVNEDGEPISGEALIKTDYTENRNLTLTGRTPVKVSNINGFINVGDQITSSSLAGIGSKATKSGVIVGKTLESTNHWNEVSCPVVNSIETINWPEDDGHNPEKPCYRVPVSSLSDEAKQAVMTEHSLASSDYFYVGKVMLYTTVSWYDPDVYLSDTGDFSMDTTALADGFLEVEIENTETGEMIDRVGVFAEALIGKIKTGFVEAEKIATSTLEATQASIDELTTNKIKLGNFELAELNGLLNIKNESGETVATIDENGNTNLAGNITAPDSDLDSSTPSQETNPTTDTTQATGSSRLAKLMSDEIETRDLVATGSTRLQQLQALEADISQLDVENLEATGSTKLAELTAQDIQAGNIEVENLQTNQLNSTDANTTNLTATGSSRLSNLMANAGELDQMTAGQANVNQAEIQDLNTQNLSSQELLAENLTVNQDLTGQRSRFDYIEAQMAKLDSLESNQLAANQANLTRADIDQATLAEANIDQAQLNVATIAGTLYVDNIVGLDGSSMVTVDPGGETVADESTFVEKVQNALRQLGIDIRETAGQMAIKIENAIVEIKIAVIQNLRIGNQDNPTGFTMFDTQTKEPYCVFIENGDLKKVEGNCEELSMSPVSSQSGELSLAN